MKTRAIIIIFFAVAISAFAAQVSPQKAETVARGFLSNNGGGGNANLSLVYIGTDDSKYLTSDNSTNAYFYVYARTGGGFVIVSGDDVAEPILGYSTSGSFKTGNIPSHVNSWLNGYKKQIQAAVSQNRAQDAVTAKEWAELSDLSRVSAFAVQQDSIPAMIKTVWDQSPYYNALCPYDETDQDRTITGCVATAMAQIMKFWNYPESGFGSHTDTCMTHGKLYADFSNTKYNWINMPDSLGESNYDVALLMLHCGISVDMEYGTENQGGSGAWSEQVPSALVNYFGYDKGAKILYKDSSGSLTQWQNIVKNELIAGRPMLYSGENQQEGHAFVCDGYGGSNYFHFNWGWSGYYNGQYKLSALYYQKDFDFRQNQSAVTGIMPPSMTSVSDDYQSADISVFPDPAYDYINVSGISESVQIDIINIEGISVQSSQYSPDESITISVRDLPAGVYFVKIISGGNATVRKFTVVK